MLIFFDGSITSVVGKKIEVDATLTFDPEGHSQTHKVWIMPNRGGLPYYVRGLPLITYAPRGGGGVNTNAYKCVQGGRGGLNITKNTHFVRRFIENAIIF